jgi:hypothetical protein
MQSPLEVLHEYYRVFGTLDLSAIVCFYCEPCLSMSPQGVFSAATRADLAAAFRPFVEGLRARGYARSELVDPQITTLTDAAALVRGVAVRYAATSVETERIPISYLMHRTGAEWKIAVIILPA